ncbi:hypothetical protein M8C21_013764 [Ambrosia artemisiifolia]|uniref:Poly(A) RNA polymerase mitochondrial-like central palm domain-containing protein n=1 Tax=Ambrosia artemisiifolia TaxID=4212 RepID=A0AAD5CEF6_AMBAR|nr:hypothetical protein M8C21_013764 [Ambrosia artemisiifolia]
MTAKVPIVKVIDTGTGVECDLSVENRDGISKSLIIRYITSIDQRFQKLSFLMKAWAKVHDINSSKDRTLNSLSIILLVAFHLQTRDPPILPPFSAILKDGEDPASVRRAVRNFKNYGIRNTETLGELFVSFLIKLASVEKLWPKGLCASPYLGHWTSKTWDTKIASMSVEDFTNRTQNVARAVGKSEVEKIYECIHLTNHSLSLFMNVKIKELELKESLFGIDRMLHPSVEPKSNVWKENYENNRHVVTTHPVLTVNNTAMDLRAAPSWSTRQPPMGHWDVPVPPHHRALTTGPANLWAEQSFDHQHTKRMRGVEDVLPTHSRGTVLPHHRAVTTGQANLWAEQLFDHKQTKRMRVAEDVPATQIRGPAWGESGRTQDWGGGVPPTHMVHHFVEDQFSNEHVCKTIDQIAPITGLCRVFV